MEQRPNAQNETEISGQKKCYTLIMVTEKVKNVEPSDFILPSGESVLACSQKVVILWHNTCPHVARTVQDTLHSMHRKVLHHYPYSPDMSL
jgi:hypothetical protein